MVGVEGLKGVFFWWERVVVFGGDEVVRYGGGGVDGRMVREFYERVEWRIDFRLFWVLGWGVDIEMSVFGVRSLVLVVE